MVMLGVTLTDAPAESPHVASPNKILTKILNPTTQIARSPAAARSNPTAQPQQPLPDSQTVRSEPSLTPLVKTNLKKCLGFVNISFKPQRKFREISQILHFHLLLRIFNFLLFYPLAFHRIRDSYTSLYFLSRFFKRI